MTALVKQLKEAGEDFEFYPTTKEMIKVIWNHKRKLGGFRAENFGDVLDIGCGTCNFKRWIDELNKPLEKRSENYVDRDKCVEINRYYIIEKSRILLDRLDAETICLGTDFHENTLIDKPVDTIFCNPPYSEYEEWAVRIITESVCKSIYLIIPQRWENSEKISLALKRVTRPYSKRSDYAEQEDAFQVLGSFDFLDAERSARAKVDVVFIDKSHTDEKSAFDSFFDTVFPMNGGVGAKESEWMQAENRAKSEREKIKSQLVAGRNKIEVLCEGYSAAQKELFDHFKAFCAFDADILETMGIKKEVVKETLKKRFSGLKNIYWQCVFDCLEEITMRLTSTSRQRLVERFALLTSVDFTAGNVYALIIWVIKNSNSYYQEQMIEFFKALSSPENIQNYKSNQRVFKRDQWGYCREKHDHYTLDYRIVCTRHALPGEDGYSYENKSMEAIFKNKISDICTVANNLEFKPGLIDIPKNYGDKGDVLLEGGGILFTFRCYQNGNVHVKFNKEFIKALNVEVARLLGWIHTAEDIKEEFPPEQAEGAEKYFNRHVTLDLRHVTMLPPPEQETSATELPEAPEPEEVEPIEAADSGQKEPESLLDLMEA